LKNNWTREEHILAFNLYCKIPFTKINANYAPIKELALLIGRTNGSVAMKLANFARLDPALKARNISGLTQGAKGEEVVWKEFNSDWNKLAWESEKILAKYKGIKIELLNDLDDEEIVIEGLEREAIIKARVNQSFFRKTILAAYNSTCCITGINKPELLIASHIIPWATNKKLRVNPTNGLCLNALHDKAFDSGLIAIRPEDYSLIISSELKQKKFLSNSCETNFISYESKPILLPDKFLPSREFLDYHYNKIFKK
jgi:putative restriction endonuclease